MDLFFFLMYVTKCPRVLDCVGQSWLQSIPGGSVSGMTGRSVSSMTGHRDMSFPCNNGHFREPLGVDVL